MDNLNTPNYHVVGELPIIEDGDIVTPASPPADNTPGHIVIRISTSLRNQAAAAGRSIDGFFGTVDGGTVIDKPIFDDLTLPGFYTPGTHHLVGTIDGHAGTMPAKIRDIDRIVTVVAGQDLVVTIE